MEKCLACATCVPNRVLPHTGLSDKTFPSGKLVREMYTPSYPTLYSKTGVYRVDIVFYFCSKT